MEAVDLAGWPADDLDQRRTLPHRFRQVGGVAHRALLLEQRRAIRRLRGRQRHLRVGNTHHQHHRGAKSQHDCAHRAKLRPSTSPLACVNSRRRKTCGGSSGLFRRGTKAVLQCCRPVPDISALLRQNRADRWVSRPQSSKPRRAAPGLDVAAALLAFEPALLRAEGRLGRAARRRPDQRFAQQFEQAVDGVGAVALLGAEALGVDHDHAVLGHALAGEAGEPRSRRRPASVSLRVSKRSCAAVESLLTFCPPGPEARTKPISMSFSSIDEIAGNPQHGVTGAFSDRRT